MLELHLKTQIVVEMEIYEAADVILLSSPRSMETVHLTSRSSVEFCGTCLPTTSWLTGRTCGTPFIGSLRNSRKETTQRWMPLPGHNCARLRTCGKPKAERLWLVSTKDVEATSKDFPNLMKNL